MEVNNKDLGLIEKDQYYKKVKLLILGSPGVGINIFLILETLS